MYVFVLMRKGQYYEIDMSQLEALILWYVHYNNNNNNNNKCLTSHN